jgi:hypothetical protein
MHPCSFSEERGQQLGVAARLGPTRVLFETAAYAYLRNARNCYDRWGALGKVKQLDERYPHLHEERTPTSSAMIGQPVGQLDVDTVVKASQALSSEIVLPKLIEKLMRIAVEHAGGRAGSAHPPSGRRAADRGGGDLRPRQGGGRRSPGSRTGFLVGIVVKKALPASATSALNPKRFEAVRSAFAEVVAIERGR